MIDCYLSLLNNNLNPENDCNIETSNKTGIAFLVYRLMFAAKYQDFKVVFKDLKMKHLLFGFTDLKKDVVSQILCFLSVLSIDFQVSLRIVQQ